MGDGGIVYYGGGDDDAAARDFCAAHRVVDGSCAAELRRMSRELDAPEVDALDARGRVRRRVSQRLVYPARTAAAAARAPGAGALGRKLGALARNASALEIGGPTTAMGGLYAQGGASVDVVNWSDQAVRKIQGNRPGGYFVVSVPWAEQTYDRRRVRVDHLRLIRRGRRGLSDDPEVLRRLEHRVRAYHRLVDLDTPHCCDDLATARRLKGYHWHAWDLALLQEAMACIGAAVEYLDIVDNWHQLVIARVPD
ncbi:hypothetical protein JL720_7462 [Aureococcus anophagefferens]|nr:hypothetical protein JL720_7462 [Aureococcus anophagefferens]